MKLGKDRGRVARVAERRDWRGDLRVDLGESAPPKARTLFRFAQVIKTGDAEPPVSDERFKDSGRNARR